MGTNAPLDVEKHPTDEYRDAKGRMIKPLPGGNVITPANASALAKKRWAKYRRAAAESVTSELKAFDPKIVTTTDAWGMLAAKQAVTLLDSDKPRVDDLLKLGQIIGAMPTVYDVKQDDTPSGGVSHASPVLLVLAELRKRGVTADVIEGKVIDNS